MRFNFVLHQLALPAGISKANLENILNEFPFDPKEYPANRAALLDKIGNQLRTRGRTSTQLLSLRDSWCGWLTDSHYGEIFANERELVRDSFQLHVYIKSNSTENPIEAFVRFISLCHKHHLLDESMSKSHMGYYLALMKNAWDRGAVQGIRSPGDHFVYIRDALRRNPEYFRICAEKQKIVESAMVFDPAELDRQLEILKSGNLGVFRHFVNVAYPHMSETKIIQLYELFESSAFKYDDFRFQPKWIALQIANTISDSNFPARAVAMFEYLKRSLKQYDSLSSESTESSEEHFESEIQTSQNSNFEFKNWSEYFDWLQNESYGGLRD